MTEKPTDKCHPAYTAGWDAGMNGTDMVNCHFGYFNTPQSAQLWEQGKKDAQKEKCK